MNRAALEMIWEVQVSEYGAYLIGAFSETLMLDGSKEDLFFVLASTPFEEIARMIVYEHNESIFRI